MTVLYLPMSREEITSHTDNRMAIGINLPVARVICNDDITHYGYFNSFDDYNELKEKNQYRFIPRNNLRAFQDEHGKKGVYNTVYSIIISGDNILSIEFVMPLHN